MKKLFQAIRRGEILTVRALLDAHPALIACTAKQPPKKDDGQSPLQVAVKCGQLEIAHLLLDRGADVNFMEAEACCNAWRMPVLHDAVRCAVMRSRWNTVGLRGELQISSSREEADGAYGLLERILELGADPGARDSYGNSAMERAVLDARQVLPACLPATGEVRQNRVVTPELRADFQRIFRLLARYGLDGTWPDRQSGTPLAERYGREPVAEFLR